MKNAIKKPYPNTKRKNRENMSNDGLIELCMEKGLIEKTDYGYYFKPEFFETLEIYE